jgi:hypothetical protein
MKKEHKAMMVWSMVIIISGLVLLASHKFDNLSVKEFVKPTFIYKTTMYNCERNDTCMSDDRRMKCLGFKEVN